jgi:hypothetical protein
MTNREEFEKWWKETKGTDIPYTGLASFTEDVMFSAWQARGELDAKRIAELEAELAEWKEVGLGHDENARQAIKQRTASEAKLAIAIKALEVYSANKKVGLFATLALTKIRGE